MQSLQIRKFDPSKMGHKKVIAIFGKRNTGKSFLLRDLCYWVRDIPAGLVMSGTEEGNSFFSGTPTAPGFVPPAYVYNDYNQPAVDKMIAHQRKMAKRGTPGNCFLVLDDLMYDAKFLKSPQIRTLVMNGRHYGVSLFLTAQYCGDIPPAIRSNIDYVFVLREPLINVREKIYKNLFGCFPNFAQFQNCMDQLTEDYCCMVLDNTSRSNDLSQQVYWYKARHRDFRMGSPSFWKYNEKVYNPNHDEEEVAAEKKKKLLPPKKVDKNALKITKVGVRR